jgi:F-type H+-transporting ATPase subunit epsilon
MILEIITPEKNVFNGEVDSVILPGKNGQFQVLKDHAPMVSTLKKGDLVYEIGSKKETILVDGGVLQVFNNKVLVLAEAVV